MSCLVLCIVGGVNGQSSIVKNFCVDGWTAQRAIIARTDYFDYNWHFLLNLYIMLLNISDPKKRINEDFPKWK